MSAIRTWSDSRDGSGNNIAAPDGFLERAAPTAGILSGSMNDSFREVMAAARTQHEAAEWIDYGDTPPTAFINANDFTLLDGTTGDSFDFADRYAAGRRIRIKKGSSFLYGTITQNFPQNGGTVVYVRMDDGSTLDSTVTQVAVGVQGGFYDSRPIPDLIVKPCGELSEFTWSLSPAESYLKIMAFPMIVKPPHGMVISHIAVMSNSGTANFPVCLCIGEIAGAFAEDYGRETGAPAAIQWKKLSTEISGSIAGSGIKFFELPTPYVIDASRYLAVGLMSNSGTEDIRKLHTVTDPTTAIPPGGSTPYPAGLNVIADSAESSLTFPSTKGGTWARNQEDSIWFGLITQDFKNLYDRWTACKEDSMPLVKGPAIDLAAVGNGNTEIPAAIADRPGSFLYAVGIQRTGAGTGTTTFQVSNDGGTTYTDPASGAVALTGAGTKAVADGSLMGYRKFNINEASISGTVNVYIETVYYVK